jgi:hypothetical protein
MVMFLGVKLVAVGWLRAGCRDSKQVSSVHLTIYSPSRIIAVAGLQSGEVMWMPVIGAP